MLYGVVTVGLTARIQRYVDKEFVFSSYNC